MTARLSLGYSVQVPRVDFGLIAIWIEHEKRATFSALAHRAACKESRTDDVVHHLVEGIFTDCECEVQWSATAVASAMTFNLQDKVAAQ